MIPFIYRHRYWLYLLPSILLTLAIYLPLTPFPFFDWDDVSYLTELGQGRSLADGLRLLDYAKSRQFWKGDEILFRPLTFAWLAIRTALFDYQYSAWNKVSVLAHALNVAAFFTALWRLKPGLLAGAVTFFFAALGSHASLVITPHLCGYLFGFFFLFCALSFLPSANRSSHFFLFLSFLSIGCFFHEMVIASVPWLALIAASQAPHSKAKVFVTATLIPISFYLLFYIPHLFRVENLFFSSGINGDSLLNFQNWLSSSMHAFRTLWAFQFSALGPLGPLKWILLALFIGAAAYHCFPLRATKHLMIRAVPLLIALHYVLMMGLMRGVHFRTYGFYFLWLMTLYGVFFFLHPSQGRSYSIYLCSFLFGALGIVHAFFAFKIQTEIRVDLAPSSSYFRQLNNFIDQRRGIPGFTFKIEGDHPDFDFQHEICEGYPNQNGSCKTLYLSHILYAPYYAATSPKFSLHWDSTKNQFSVYSDA